MNLTVEEALRVITEKAAVVRFLSGTATKSPETPDSAVLSGLGEVCADIEALTARVKLALQADALDAELPRLE